MWHSSRVSALRRGPNSHEGGKSAWSRAGQRVGTRSPEELTQDAPTSLSMAPIWQRRSHPVARGARFGANQHPQPGQRLGQRPRTKQRLLTVSTETKPPEPNAAAARRQARFGGNTQPRSLHPSACARATSAATPNPSLNRTRYGKHRKPGPRHMVHHRVPGLRCSPPRSG